MRESQMMNREVHVEMHVRMEEDRESVRRYVLKRGGGGGGSR